MKTGSKYQIFIPSKLAYGEAGIKGVIPANATLIFEVELLAVKDAGRKRGPRGNGLYQRDQGEETGRQGFQDHRRGCHGKVAGDKSGRGVVTHGK